MTVIYYFGSKNKCYSGVVGDRIYIIFLILHYYLKYTIPIIFNITFHYLKLI
jgi:hypothetical protein